ncbi:MAG: hypothetical protein ACRDY7_13475 [Acidimicrobiia bacterium]
MLNDDRVRMLAAHRGSPVVTSCYLDVDGKRHTRPADYEVQLDHLMRAARERASAAGAETARSVDGDVARITRWVRAGFDRSGVRGLAFFSCSAEGFFEVVPLPLPVRNQIALEPSPHLHQLECVLGEYDRFAVVLVDRQRARLFRFECGELTEHTELFDAVPRRQDSGGRSAASIARHTTELVHKHLKHAAEVTFDEFRARSVDHLILGGPGEVVAEFEGLLHSYLRDRLAARLSIMVTASPDEVRAAALAVEADLRRRADAALVADLRDALGAGNGGIAGLEPTLRALVERRVGVLLVSDGYAAEGWCCPSCRFLGVLGRTCPVCAKDMDLVDDVVGHAVDEALVNNCRVEIVRDNADLDVLGRIGALLRF